MAVKAERIRDRRIFALIQDRLRDEPVIALHGPRSVGKSTLLRQVAVARGVDVIDLDDPATRDAVASDPAIFAGGPEPVCIDEYQKVPLVLDVLKAELNRDTHAGRYLLTGSTRYSSLPREAQSLTGRLHALTVLPLSQGEIDGVREDRLEALFSDPAHAVHGPVSTSSRDDYVRRVTTGGFPLALERADDAARNRWFDDYVRLTLERDVLDMSRVRQRDQLPHLLASVAGQTGQLLNMAAAARRAGIEERTAEDYIKLLEAVFLIDRLPAWGTTLRARAGAKPKIHVVDAGVAARLMRLTPQKLRRLDPSSLTEFGHLLETFVVWEIRKQASWMDGVAGLGHWRTGDDDEVDLVVERDDGAIVAIEIKAGTRVPTDQLKGLRKLRDALGDAFVAGVAMYTGARAYTAEDRIHVMPIDYLWTLA